MSLFGLSFDREEKLAMRILALGVKESDITEKFIRAQGRGGQKVNKSSTCVYLKHLPSGIEVKCQKERYQGLNRYYARKILADKIESLLKERRSCQEQLREKICRQKRKRSKKQKLKILEQKRRLSEKKRLRGRVSERESQPF